MNLPISDHKKSWLKMAIIEVVFCCVLASAHRSINFFQLWTSSWSARGPINWLPDPRFRSFDSASFPPLSRHRNPYVDVNVDVDVDTYIHTVHALLHYIHNILYIHNAALHLSLIEVASSFSQPRQRKPTAMHAHLPISALLVAARQ